METFIMKYGLITLPAVITGLYLLRTLQQLYQEKLKKERQPVPITIRKEGNISIKCGKDLRGFH